MIFQGLFLKASGSSSVLVAKWYLTLCDGMYCRPLGSSAHGILQGRILEWAAFPFSSGSSNPGIKPRSPALQADSLLSEPPRKSICKS